MPMMDPDRSFLLIIDLQERLMPAIETAEAVLGNAAKLCAAARQLQVPALVTEQNASRLGGTVSELDVDGLPRIDKMSFDATRCETLAASLPQGKAAIVVGCEAHVCVLQTVLGLRATGRQVFVVGDAIGSRRTESRAAAIARMERHGAEMVTTEMVLFEWLGSAEHPRFREIMALIK